MSKTVAQNYFSVRQKEITQMAKKESKTEIVNETAVVESKNMVKFAESQDIPGAMKALIFTPKNYNGKYINVGLFDATSAINAIQEFLGEIVVSGGPALHVRTQSYSLYDGTRSFYLGDSQVLNAVQEGQKFLIVNVGGKSINVTLPRNDEKVLELVGPWTMCNMRLGGFASALPAKDPGHKINMAKKHEVLELLFRGTKLVIFTEPSMAAGKVYNYANTAALELQKRIVDENGEIKSAGEIANAYFEAKREFVPQNKLVAQAQRIAKVAPVLNLQASATILVDGNPTKPDDVPSGRYIVTKEEEADRVITHVRNLDSVNMLTMLATRGCALVTQRRF